MSWTIYEPHTIDDYRSARAKKRQDPAHIDVVVTVDMACEMLDELIERIDKQDARMKVNDEIVNRLIERVNDGSS